MKNLFILLWMLVNATAIAQDTPARIYFNGVIFSGEASRPNLEAVAIRQDKIIAVGTLGEVQKAAGNAALAVDLQGACMMPGMIDSHNHAISGGRSLLVANLGDTLLRPDDLSQYALRSVANGRGLRGDIIYIQGLHSATWNDPAGLQRAFDRPELSGRAVFLIGSDGHTAWANKTILKLAQIDGDYVKKLPAEQQNYFGFSNGQLNGLLSEQAIQYVQRVIPASTIDPVEALIAACRHLNSLGITAWMDPAAGSSEDGLNNVCLRAYEDASKQNGLTAHVTTLLVANGNEEPSPQIAVVRSWQQRLAPTPVSLAGFKIFADGVMEYPTQTASMHIPYKNSGEHGSRMVDREKFKQFAIASDHEKLLLHVHAIGDRAVTESLDAVAAARKFNKNSNIPHSVTHLQCVRPADLSRFKQLNVLAAMQLLWATADLYTEELVKPYIDKTSYEYMYPARSVHKAGGIVCGASDWPVSSANPFEAIYTAETRTGTKGILNANEIMTRKDMLQAYTMNAARAILRDKETGSIAAGKYADLIVVDRDVLTVSSEALRDAKILWTMVNGTVVFQR